MANKKPENLYRGKPDKNKMADDKLPSALQPDLLGTFLTARGLTPRNIAVYQQAFTHGSFVHEHPSLGLQDNQRLEFLGDSAVGLMASELVFASLIDADEGRLTHIRNAIVRNTNLATYAQQLGFDQMLLLGNGERATGGATKLNNLGDMFEAVCGAILLDLGLEALRAFVTPLFKATLNELLAAKVIKDACSLLQEWSQKHYQAVPIYAIERLNPTENVPQFAARVSIDNTIYGEGHGPSKAEAKQKAAQAALDKLSILDRQRIESE
jgi:ribonuclease III